MYRRRAPTKWFALTFAIVAGVLLADGQWIAGGVLGLAGAACAAADYFDKGDSSGLYGQ